MGITLPAAPGASPRSAVAARTIPVVPSSRPGAGCVRFESPFAADRGAGLFRSQARASELEVEMDDLMRLGRRAKRGWFIRNRRGELNAEREVAHFAPRHRSACPADR